MPQSDPIQSVTVYCSSSSTVPKIYFDTAVELGTALARENWTLVYGGNAVGVMQALSDAVRAAGGKVVGITPQLLLDKGIADRKCHELIVTTTMRQRKMLMEQRGDAFITLPGGLGTLEEIFEIIVGRQLGYHAKPIVLLNIAGYFDPLLAMIEHGIAQHFIKTKARELYFVTDQVSRAIEYLQNPPPVIPHEKWAGKNPPSALE
jgi:uncharacterized protein (TIGR00730 family)